MVTETWKYRSLRNMDGMRDKHAHSYLELYAIDGCCPRINPPQPSNRNCTLVIPTLALPPADWED